MEPNENESDALDELEADHLLWLLTCFPADFALAPAPHHDDFWRWVWSISRYHRPKPRVECVFRDSGKSTNLELLACRLATVGRRYGLYVMRTQDQADQKVENVAAKLGETPAFGAFYPEHADRAVNKYGYSRGWRRNRITTRGGFTLDAAGLDRAIRGIRKEAQRPDFILIDDIDDPDDSVAVVEKHERRLSRAILPTRSPAAVVVYMQNLVHKDGVMSRLLDGRADYLRDAVRVGPIPAVRDLEYDTRPGEDGRTVYRITGGTPSWPAGFDLVRAESEMNSVGATAFLSEHQNDPRGRKGEMFAHVDFPSLRVHPDDLPRLDRLVLWLDPAVEDDPDSAQGIAVLGVARNGTIFVLYGYEQKVGPLAAMRQGIRVARRYRITRLKVEKNQGGATWQSVFVQALDKEGVTEPLTLERHPVSEGKEERLSDMLGDLELGRVKIVEGTHDVVEAAFERFPHEPNDLADAIWHGWSELRPEYGSASWSSGDRRLAGVRPR